MAGAYLSALARHYMPGKDEHKVETQEPSSQENEQKQQEESAERYEDRVNTIITGVMNQEEGSQ